MTSSLPATTAFAQLLAAQQGLAATPDLATICQGWPAALIRRLLATLPSTAFIAACRALPDLNTAARLAIHLRAAAWDDACRYALFDQLAALHAQVPARAMTLRRLMDWAPEDAALLSRILPNAPDPWPADPDNCAIAVALAAEAHWESLPLPCIYRFPAPMALPDTWATPEIRSTAVCPAPIEIPLLSTVDPVLAGTEWLHLARIDRPLAEIIAQSLPTGLLAHWQSALFARCEDEHSAPLPENLRALETLWHHEHPSDEPGRSFLSQNEVDALLNGVTQHDYSGSSPALRHALATALRGWLSLPANGIPITDPRPPAL